MKEVVHRPPAERVAVAPADTNDAAACGDRGVVGSSPAHATSRAANESNDGLPDRKLVVAEFVIPPNSESVAVLRRLCMTCSGHEGTASARRPT